MQTIIHHCLPLENRDVLRKLCVRRAQIMTSHCKHIRVGVVNFTAYLILRVKTERRERLIKETPTATVQQANFNYRASPARIGRSCHCFPIFSFHN